MGDAHADISKHVKSYIGVFVALAIMTVVTVGASRVDFTHWGNITIALAIAGFKASLVAAIFMHLKWEKAPWIWWVLALCAVAFLILMAVPVLSVNDHPPGVKIGTWG